MSERIERVVTSGTFSLDGGCWDVDNNVWIIGNDSSVIIIDPAHDVDKISRTVAGRTGEDSADPRPRRPHPQRQGGGRTLRRTLYLNPADRVLLGNGVPLLGLRSRTVDGDVPRIGDTELKRPRDPGHSPAPCASTHPPRLGELRRRRLPATPSSTAPRRIRRSATSTPSSSR